MSECREKPIPVRPRRDDFLDHHRGVKEIRAHAAVLFGQVRTQHALLPRLGSTVTVDMALFFPLGMERHRMLFEELADAVAKEFVL